MANFGEKALDLTGQKREDLLFYRKKAFLPL